MNRGATALSNDYLRLGERLADALGNPAIDGLYLPAAIPDETFRDEFGFVFLADGSIGPFYVSMQDILQTLWTRHPVPGDCRLDARSLLQGFDDTDPARRALAVGAYNALSAALYRATDYRPPDRIANSGLDIAPNNGPVGMVGYFCPLVDKLTEQGCQVRILERSPERVPSRSGVSVITAEGGLRGCRQVLCTASTLITDGLEDVLANIDADTQIELIGPSGSGLPDPLFARGVHATGGIAFVDRDQLIGHLRRAESWGRAGRKYQLHADSYPGIDVLLKRLADSHTHAGDP